MKKISVVTPCYNEELSIAECHAAAGIFDRDLPGYEQEHIFCDNASTDRSLISSLLPSFQKQTKT